MFGLGATEILLILIVVLVLLAMGKLPDVARKAGGAYRTYRKVDQEVKNLADPVTWIETAAGDEKEEDRSPPEKKT